MYEGKHLIVGHVYLVCLETKQKLVLQDHNNRNSYQTEDTKKALKEFKIKNSLQKNNSKTQDLKSSKRNIITLIM